MLACPNCNKRLARQRTPNGVAYGCPSCGGQMASVAILRKERAAQGFMNQAWRRAREGRSVSGRACPHCRLPMSQVLARAGENALQVDVCLRCASLWFDSTEYAAVPKLGPVTGRIMPLSPHTIEASAPGVKSGPLRSGLTPGEARAAPRIRNVAADLDAARRPLSPRARQAVARLEVEGTRDEHERVQDVDVPAEPWQYLPAVFGLPVEVGARAVKVRAWATWGVAALAAIVFFGAPAAGGLGDIVGVWGFIPDEWGRHGGATILTSFVLHAGLVHLLANLYFLLVFGDNVEERLGVAGFLALLLFAHGAGVALHCYLDPRSTLPLVGASAGISGVVAYYAVAFPRARLGFILWIFLYPKWIRLPAWGWFGLWMVLQLIGAWQQFEGFSNVSALAHLGGAAVGVVAALVTRERRKEALRMAGAGRREP